ncbi:hypothetical protein CTAM01_14697 [Colletotrichum tamarilloi]|uniref:Uncharacterized protein n=1 Tax=Colletotrichum tamarilloi TaxID=1209934 RepID=A0ABQ9QNG1_9PEZI|nr:uncharacterized protein CTAM01_14697 [Colletotrichum tamarilloi]KAK1479350.1 hypothetical protein CTAM01_14697 [Colletotrichum tamarilloi]
MPHHKTHFAKVHLVNFTSNASDRSNRPSSSSRAALPHLTGHFALAPDPSPAETDPHLGLPLGDSAPGGIPPGADDWTAGLSTIGHADATPFAPASLQETRVA